IKRILSLMNSRGQFEGRSIMEIKLIADEYYSIDFPIPVLRQILEEIQKQVNTETSIYFQLYGDGAFSINKYTFVEYDEEIRHQKEEIKQLEGLFRSFCESSG